MTDALSTHSGLLRPPNDEMAAGWTDVARGGDITSVTLKSGVLDPQGKAIEGALRTLGVKGVASVRQGKVFDIELGTRPAGAGP